MDVRSKLNYNAPNSKSLRTTVPEAIVEVLKLKAGDTINWELEFPNGKLTVIVTKIEE